SENGLQESGASLPPHAGRLEQCGRSGQLSRRELAADRLSGDALVEGTPLVEPNLAQRGMVGGRVGKLAAELSGASPTELPRPCRGLMKRRTAGSQAWRTRPIAATVVAAFLLSPILPAPVSADPPPWAPAHGWRAKHKKHDGAPVYDDSPVYVVQPYPYYVRPQPYAVPFGIDLGRCNRDAVGAALGGAAGAAIGAGVTDPGDPVAR